MLFPLVHEESRLNCNDNLTSTSMEPFDLSVSLATLIDHSLRIEPLYTQRRRHDGLHGHVPRTARCDGELLPYHRRRTFLERRTRTIHHRPRCRCRSQSPSQTSIRWRKRWWTRTRYSCPIGNLDRPIGSPVGILERRRTTFHPFGQSPSGSLPQTPVQRQGRGPESPGRPIDELPGQLLERGGFG